MSFCISASPEIRELAERTALVTLAMCEALGSIPQPSLPGGYRYHIYGGLPGFADHAAHAADAALELHHALEPYGIECVIDITLDYATVVIDADVRLGGPVPPVMLTALGEDACRRAVQASDAVLRKCGEPEYRNYDDAQG